MTSHSHNFKFLTRFFLATATVATSVVLFPELVRASNSRISGETISEHSVKLVSALPKQGKQANSGQSLNNLGNFEEFMRAAPFYLRGNDLLKKKDYQGAIEQYNIAISNYSEHAEAYAQRGVARNQIGDRAGAIQDLQQAAIFFEAQGQPAAVEKVQEILDRLQQ
ncbi:tetratricopeptide repeat protein [Oxynema sp. CENA135]|nr:tetratricopeptide repeat protein [Oxynema sp. CENA135]